MVHRLQTQIGDQVVRKTESVRESPARMPKSTSNFISNDPIVITGVGVLSPNGTDRESYFAATAQGRSGIRTITQFDPEALPCRIAGEVDFDPTRWVDAKNIRHVSRVVPMAIAAA